MPLTTTTDSVLTSLAGHPHDSTAPQVARLVDPFDPGSVAVELDALTAAGLLQHVGPSFALTTRGWREIRSEGGVEDVFGGL